MTRLFGTNGVRGIVDETMTEDLAQRLGKATGTWMEAGQTIAIARDARTSGPRMQAAFERGARSTGVHTRDLGVLASPGAQLYVRDKNVHAGAIITASHNPAAYNGIKLIAPDGTETSREQEEAVEAHFFAEDFRSGEATHDVDESAATYYLDSVLAKVDVEAIRAAGLKAVLDPGGGAGCVTAPRLLAALGIEVVPISCALDGEFSDRPSEPSPVNSQACMDAVKEHGADLGILQDGDADRAIFIDEHGDYVWGDQSLALATLHELRRYPKDRRIMCTAVSSSSCVQDAVDLAEGRLEWTVVGSPIVAREMMRHHAVFGGEDNGGLMFERHQICRDGLMAMAFILELIATSGRSLSDLLSEIPDYFLVKEKIEVPDAEKEPLLARFKQALTSEEGIKTIDDRDGVKAYLDKGWVLVRPSGTEAIFRIQAEAKDEADATALAARFKGLLESLVVAA